MLTRPAPIQRPRLPYVALGLLWLAALDCRTPLVAIGPLLPVLMIKLHLDSLVASTATAIPLLLIALISIPAGYLADRHGPRVILVIALGILTISCAIPLISGSIAGLFTFVSGTGIGIGLAQPTLAKMARHFLPSAPTLPTALYANALVVGGMVSSLLSTPVFLPLAGVWSWRGVIADWGVLVMLATIGWSLQKRDMTVPTPHYETARAGLPLLPGFIPIALAFAGQGAVFYAFVTWMPQFFVRAGWSISSAAIPLAVLSFGSICGGLSAPWVLRIGHGFRKPFIGSALLLALSILGLTQVMVFAYLWAWIIGATTAVVFTLGLAAPPEITVSHNVGRLSGLLLAIGYIGAVIGPIGYGLVQPLAPNASMFYLIGLSLAIAIAGFFIPSNLRYQSQHGTRT